MNICCFNSKSKMTPFQLFFICFLKPEHLLLFPNKEKSTAPLFNFMNKRQPKTSIKFNRTLQIPNLHMRLINTLNHSLPSILFSYYKPFHTKQLPNKERKTFSLKNEKHSTGTYSFETQKSTKVLILTLTMGLRLPRKGCLKPLGLEKPPWLHSSHGGFSTSIN